MQELLPLFTSTIMMDVQRIVFPGYVHVLYWKSQGMWFAWRHSKNQMMLDRNAALVMQW